MDLGIAGRTALVCGASAGLGYACAEALAAEGVHLFIVARGAERLEAAALALRDHQSAHRGGSVQAVSADVTTEAGRNQVLSACPNPDILITNAGGPPAGDFRAWTRDTWMAALDANMLAPIELIKASVDGMMARSWGRIINITSSAVKSPVDGLGLSTGARSGLTGFVASLARSTVAHGVTINNLLPGTFETDRLRGNIAAWARRDGITPEQARAQRLAKHPAHRFGQPAELGHTCAYLCSVHAGYINGQNILLDGGSFNSVL